MSITKKLVAKLAGKRKAENIDLIMIKSVLLKPIGDAIGDAVAHTAHLKQLKLANPELVIGVIVTERNRDIFAYSDLVDVLLEDKPLTYISQCRKWDLYLDFQPTYTTKSIILEKLLSPKYIIVFNKKHKENYNLDTIKNYNFACPQNDTTHISEYLNDSAISAYLDPKAVEYALINQETIRFEVLWGDKVRILLAPEGSTRKIPANEFAELLNSLSPTIVENVLFVLTNTKESATYYEELISLCDNKIQIKLSPKTTIQEYIQLVSSADLIIGVDSGTVHLATALQKKVLAFYARNIANFCRWQPKGKAEVPYKAIMSKTESDSNNHTCDFPMDEAADWVNHLFQTLPKH
ncbi:glycosyltransferase family 9 protein [Aggregatibacter actinomycetemcomitans]|uniref:glycosyltransferase family 9 protein n=1 Tax=Aggregatibacter actinomycetemcomitans TaxID=714 RepID=UPI00197B65DD|nr:glycosyltransferase family 9 protein [Aggregatibacter actinomycetemcomitans]MBN6068449.1 glycosyltransferase family 9 protein [Aggregatibacter actinomycetemcomitans]MBN6085033.1 glycosyltransferase family 9 protein [Aggregatibacter actinomycetemcomitans]